jgi:Uma2 family endonuclease
VDKPELHLGEDVLVPHLAGWRRERMPRFPRTAFVSQAPDWVCEVLSPGTRRIDLGAKRDLYGEQGVGHLWLVDPDARTLEVFARQSGAWVLLGTLTGEAEVRMAPFEAVGFPLGALWPDDGEGEAAEA